KACTLYPLRIQRHALARTCLHLCVVSSAKMKYSTTPRPLNRESQRRKQPEYPYVPQDNTLATLLNNTQYSIDATDENERCAPISLLELHRFHQADDNAGVIQYQLYRTK